MRQGIHRTQKVAEVLWTKLQVPTLLQNQDRKREETMRAKIQCQYCDSLYEAQEGEEALRCCSIECYDKFRDLRNEFITCIYCERNEAVVVDFVPRGRYGRVPSCLRCFAILAHQIAPTLYARKTLVEEYKE